jgi:uncharacterized OB-fold protein
MSETPIWPRPRIDALNRHFWAGIEEKRLLLQRCEACDHVQIPPLSVCPACLGSSLAWTEAGGGGVLRSWTVFHRAYWTSLAPALPYAVCLVALDEGPLFLGHFADCDAPRRAVVGQRVTARIVSIEPDLKLVAFDLSAPRADGHASDD